MSERTNRTPPKQRGTTTVLRVKTQRQSAPRQGGAELLAHLGGQFEQHDHGDGHGPIGFTQHLLP